MTAFRLCFEITDLTVVDVQDLVTGIGKALRAELSDDQIADMPRDKLEVVIEHTKLKFVKHGFGDYTVKIRTMSTFMDKIFEIRDEINRVAAEEHANMLYYWENRSDAFW